MRAFTIKQNFDKVSLMGQFMRGMIDCPYIDVDSTMPSEKEMRLKASYSQHTIEMRVDLLSIKVKASKSFGVVNKTIPKYALDYILSQVYNKKRKPYSIYHLCVELTQYTDLTQFEIYCILRNMYPYIKDSGYLIHPMYASKSIESKLTLISFQFNEFM